MRWLVVPLTLFMTASVAPRPASSAPAPKTSEVLEATFDREDDVEAEAFAEPEDDHAGEATYYRPGAKGACGTPTPDDRLTGALGSALYSKAHCGQCATVTGPRGSVTVVLNERCGACKGASMDLSTPAFEAIADKTDGRVKITWHFTDCP